MRLELLHSLGSAARMEKNAVAFGLPCLHLPVLLFLLLTPTSPPPSLESNKEKRHFISPEKVSGQFQPDRRRLERSERSHTERRRREE